MIALKKPNLSKYGVGSWVMITGASSGQGKELAIQLSELGFNIILVGSERCYNVAQEIHTKTVVIVKNFSNAFEPHFFDELENEFKTKKISILINNVGHRTGWIPYHQQPIQQLYDTIACGTIVQSRLTQIAIPYMLQYKSSIVFITAQCIHPNFGFGIGVSNNISVPYLSVYEAANAFGYFHACSLIKEYGNQIDMLNITPGAVITENTTFLDNTIFAIDAKTFVKNIIKLIGHSGTTCAYWGHDISPVLIGVFPFIKNFVLNNVGKNIATHCMNK